MKGNKIILLLLMVTVFTLITEIEDRVLSFSDAVYERFIADLSTEDHQKTSENSAEADLFLSSYLPDQ